MLGHGHCRQMEGCQAKYRLRNPANAESMLSLSTMKAAKCCHCLPIPHTSVCSAAFGHAKSGAFDALVRVKSVSTRIVCVRMVITHSCLSTSHRLTHCQETLVIDDGTEGPSAYLDSLFTRFELYFDSGLKTIVMASYSEPLV